MPTETPVPEKESRKSRSVPLRLSVYSPGHERLEKLIRKTYGEHDLRFRHHDNKRWQILYQLFNHCTNVERISHAVANLLAPFFGWSEYDTSVLRVAALAHDLGKTDRTCWKYRSKDTFSKQERYEFTKKHQLMSRRAVMNLKPLVRLEDRPLLVRVGLITGHHHDDPHEISHQAIIIPCMVIRMVDIFVTVQEDRGYQKPRSRWEAVNLIRDVVEDWRLDPRFAPYLYMAEAIRDAISELYGAESIGISSSE
jgi:HD-GYP domain-containing protein (c-di-GMP phosphodiesterase class II)